VQQPREQAGGGACAAAEAKDRKQEDRWRTKRRYSVCQRADQRLLRSGDPWRYGPCQGLLLIRTLFATCRSPGGTVCVRGRSASCWGVPTAQPQVCGPCQGLTNVLLPWSYGPCQGPISVLLPSTDPLEVWFRVREPITILLPSADPWSLRSVSGANERPLTKCQPPWKYGPCQGAD
jgi:hypothetical protein